MLSVQKRNLKLLETLWSLGGGTSSENEAAMEERGARRWADIPSNLGQVTPDILSQLFFKDFIYFKRERKGVRQRG